MIKQQQWGHIMFTPDPPSKPTANTTVTVSEPDFLETVGNRIYFYAPISGNKILTLNRKLREVSNDMIYEQLKMTAAHPNPIFLHINSYGGSIFDGLSALDEIRNCPVPVNTVVDGACASAATFLSIVGTHRQIKQHSCMLIHQLRSMMWGTYTEFVDEQQNLDMLMKKIKSIYKQYTKVPMKNLDEILKHDLWFDAKQCLEYGLVDEIIE